MTKELTALEALSMPKCGAAATGSEQCKRQLTDFGYVCLVPDYKPDKQAVNGCYARLEGMM
jgi:hypothetical protein